ncbi:MAG: glucose-1-phosphate thymidylyltransferase [Thermoleophilia bacterium]|nr:glucose-1-phosphate thymidylyltransferase [Thermoleophilia bacterium]
MTDAPANEPRRLKGLVLSGGAGTRLRPITHTSAKQLVPVANKPVLFYGLEALAEAGIKEVGIIVGDTAAEIEAAVGNGSQFGLEITIIPQTAPLGLAHAVLTAADFLGDDSFVMYLGDNLLRDGITELVQRFEEERPDSLILLTEVPDPQSYGVAQLDGERIVKLVEKPKNPPSNLALVGVYVFSSKILDASRAIKPSWRNELEITDAIQHLIDTGNTVAWEKVGGWWKDTGKLEDMLEANRLILDAIETRIEGDVADDVTLEGRVVIEKGASLERCKVRGPAIIGKDTIIRDAYIGPYTSVYWGCTIERAELEHSIVLEQTVIQDLDTRLTDSLLGKNVVVDRNNQSPRGTVRLMVGDNSSISL